MVSDAQFEDAADAIRTLADRLTTAEEGLNGAILAVSTLAAIISQIDPNRMDLELRRLRVWVQDSEAGRTGSKLAKQNRAQLKILEAALKGPRRTTE